jgi:hypothetical protein
MTTNLTDQDRADLARFLREAIEADRYPLSPRVRRLKELLAKIDPAPAPTVTPYLVGTDSRITETGAEPHCRRVSASRSSKLG